MTLRLPDLKHHPHFINAVAEFYPLTAEIIGAYVDLWDWEHLSRNRQTAWTEALVDEHADRWDWYSLGRNEAVPWSVGLVTRHVKARRTDWGSLRWQGKLLSTPELAELSLRQWSALPSQWADNPAGRYVPFQFSKWGADAATWAPAIVVDCENLVWREFSAISGFPWTSDFIAEHADRLDWRALSWNIGLPWDAALLRRFADRFHWDRMSYQLPWTAEMLREFGDRVNWRSIPIKWTTALVEEFTDRIYWAHARIQDGSLDGFDGVFNAEGVEWTAERFARLGPRIEAHFDKLFDEIDEDGYDEDEDDNDGGGDGGGPTWTYYATTANWSIDMFDAVIELGAKLGRDTIDWDMVARSARTPWTDAFFTAHAAQLNPYYLADNVHVPVGRFIDQIVPRLKSDFEWKTLSQAKGLVLTRELIDRYDRWDWKALSSNRYLSPELLDGFVDRWSFAALAENPAVPLGFLLRHAGRLDRSHWRALSRRVTADDPAFDATSPWDWSVLLGRHDANFRIADHVDTPTIVSFLRSLRDDRTPERHLELEATISTDLHDLGAYSAYADWLHERDDPHGELIALAIRHRTDPSLEAAMRTAETSYRDRVELERFTHAVWRLGFIDEIRGIGKNWPVVLRTRACRFLRGLSFAERSVYLEDEDIAAIVGLTCLERLSVRSAHAGDFSSLRSLPRLRDLRLDHTAVSDLAFVASLPVLEQLSVWDTKVVDLEPLRHARSLHALHIGHNPITSLEPLRGLPNLVELDIRYSDIESLEPLESCSSLRYLLVDESRVPPAEATRLTQVIRGLQITRYENWPGATTMLPFWDHSYWKPLPEPRH